MDKSDILAFINLNQICHLASIEDGKPHVRTLLIFCADEGGILFHTSKSKDLYKQLIKNPAVQLCFNDYENNLQVRVSGTVEFIEDDEIKHGIVALREQLKPWVAEAGLEKLAVCRVRNGVATVWTPENTFLPKQYIKL